MKIKLGYKVRDKLTGFEGIVTGISMWLYGCNRVGIESPELYKGKPVGDQWFDEQRIEILAETTPEISQDNTATTGGPKLDPVRPKAR